MISVQIVGGLGNQMFQYAMARRMAGKGDGVVLADLYQLGVNVQPARKYRLDKFLTLAEVVPWSQVAHFDRREFLTRFVRRSLPKKAAEFLIGRAASHGWKSCCHYRLFNYRPELPMPPLKVGRTVAERHFHFDPEVLGLSGDLLLVGFWQSEKYFADISSQLRREFQLRAPLSQFDQALTERMQEGQSVSLHVRRGDKVAAKDFNATSLEFCLRAMEWFRSAVTSPVFYIFSDDWGWTRQHLPEASDIVHVSHHSVGDDVEDWRWEENLHLMSRCRHHIIAPSSFSWWAAWLNPDADKLVVSPPHQRWHNFPGCDTADVIPDSWVQIDDR